MIAINCRLSTEAGQYVTEHTGSQYLGSAVETLLSFAMDFGIDGIQTGLDSGQIKPKDVGCCDNAVILKTEYESNYTINVWNSIYDFIPINVKSASNIFARYQNEYNNSSYEIVIVFCDTDKSPYREYSQIKKKINAFHNSRTAAGKIIIFANPCTMQIILSHFGDIKLINQGKKTNANVIYDLTGVKNYNAHENQIKEICNKIYRRTYNDMKTRISNINNGDDISGSTNFIEFIENFESENPKWIQEINKQIIRC